MIRILHLSPDIPPTVCGVGDYANTVGLRMEELYPGVHCGYIAAGWRNLQGTATDRQVALWQRLDKTFQKIGVNICSSAASAVIVHYSGYGFDPNGAPEWLASALEDRPDSWKNLRVVTFFHELYATGKPWRRVFWYSRKQRVVAERIARASDALVTNRPATARWLEKTTNRSPNSIPHLPVPSNVGEPVEAPAYDQRPPHAVVFGSIRHKRAFLVGNGARRTAKMCQHLGITRLTDIGACHPIQPSPFTAAGIEVIQTGYLPKEEVSRLMLESRVGFATYFPGYLAKSSVISAYIAHGVAIFADPWLEPELGTLLATPRPSSSIIATAKDRAEAAIGIRVRQTVSVHATTLVELLNVTVAKTRIGTC